MLDLKIYEPTRALIPNASAITILDEEPIAEFRHLVIFQFRYVVHRQHVGFFTPVVFDVEFSFTENEEDDNTTRNWLYSVAEPFIEGALFMNHTSQFIVDMLKGQEAGYNRKTLLEDIRKSVVNEDKLWYSDWMVPPPTRQNQRVVVYDLEYTLSLLDPQNVVDSFPEWVSKHFTKFDPKHIFKSRIISGYTQKTV
jgi:hypothetical protein